MLSPLQKHVGYIRLNTMWPVFVKTLREYITENVTARASNWSDGPYNGTAFGAEKKKRHAAIKNWFESWLENWKSNGTPLEAPLMGQIKMIDVAELPCSLAILLIVATGEVLELLSGASAVKQGHLLFYKDSLNFNGGDFSQSEIIKKKMFSLLNRLFPLV